MSGRWSITRLLTTIAISVAAWLAIAMLCMMIGSTGHFGWPAPQIWIDRQTPVLMASLIGAALAGAGVAYQAVLRNPLADPYLLSASSGAALMAYLWRLPFASGFLVSGMAAAMGQQGFAFIGALLSVAIVFALAGARGRLEPLTLLLVGVIMNSVNGSLFLLVDALHKNLPAGAGPMTFLIGAIQTNTSFAQLLAATVLCAVGTLVLLLISGELNAAVLSDDEAIALGVRVQRLRWIALIVASLMTAAVVAISGPIGFIGLICPHLARLVVGRDARILIPASMAIGAMLLAIADALSRTLLGVGAVQTELPVGVLTGLLGGPFFLLLLFQERRQR
ncbi:MAG: iron ABC transporter permease [Phycisphaerae bacterium]|nr:iron ABC transporter permease [Phycisphaerae bacterium]